MKLVVTDPDESPPAGNEIAWRRELKQLRVRVAQLEAEQKTRLDPLLEVSQDGKHGKHGSQCGNPCVVVVADKEPLVECKACGAELDPVDVLREYARHERRFCFALEHLRGEKIALATEIEKLKRLRARLRAEARALLPSQPVRRGERKYERDLRANVQLDRVLAREPGDEA